MTTIDDLATPKQFTVSALPLSAALETALDRCAPTATHPHGTRSRSAECFPAGTFVTTTRGQVSIEDVRVGDAVLTHLGRWRPVVRTQHRQADTIMVRGHGHPGLEVAA